MMTNEQIEEYFDNFKEVNAEIAAADSTLWFEEQLENVLIQCRTPRFVQLELSLTD